MAPMILVVEDEPAVRRVAAEILTVHNYRVVVTSTANEALRIIFDGTQVDLLLTDIVMPKMDGLALAREARRLRPTLRVLYMTGYRDEERLRGDALCGPILWKPFGIESLLEAVRAALAGGAAGPP